MLAGSDSLAHIPSAEARVGNTTGAGTAYAPDNEGRTIDAELQACGTIDSSLSTPSAVSCTSLAPTFCAFSGLDLLIDYQLSA
jgi:hypothetical protein